MVYPNEKEDNTDCALQLALKSNDPQIVKLFLSRVKMLEEHYKNTIDIHDEAENLPVGKKRKYQHDY